MTDQTIETMLRLRALAEEHGAVIERVEVTLHEKPEGIMVGFTAHLTPKPLEQSTTALGYIVTGEA